MSKVLVSFSTRPGHGSEGGVGWSFLKAALEVCAGDRETLFVICDARDAQSIRQHIAPLEGLANLELRPIEIPRMVWRHYGESRTRETYLAWRSRAIPEVKRLCKAHDVELVHQTTFATAVLPPAIPSGIPGKTVWGPLSVPWAAAYPEGGKPRIVDHFGVKVARRIAARNVQGIDLAVATNDLTAALFARSGTAVTVEPNIVVEAPKDLVFERDPMLISMVGLLTDLKRPWLAVQAMRDPALSSFRLQIIGDGPLRGRLQSYVNQERLTHRVSFTGRVAHELVPKIVASSRMLLHPSVREGASWVVGEAAAVGVPSIVFETVGAATTVRLSDNGGYVCSSEGDLVSNLVRGVLTVASQPQPRPSTRWSSTRLPAVLKSWWS